MDYMDSFVYLFYLLILNVIKPIMFFIISRKILLFCIFFIGMVILRLRCLIFSFFLSILHFIRVVLFSIFLFQLLHQRSCMFLHHFENLLSRFLPRFSHPQNDRCPYLTLNRLQIILHILWIGYNSLCLFHGKHHFSILRHIIDRHCKSFFHDHENTHLKNLLNKLIH